MARTVLVILLQVNGGQTKTNVQACQLACTSSNRYIDIDIYSFFLCSTFFYLSCLVILGLLPPCVMILRTTLAVQLAKYRSNMHLAPDNFFWLCNAHMWCIKSVEDCWDGLRFCSAGITHPPAPAVSIV